MFPPFYISNSSSTRSVEPPNGFELYVPPTPPFLHELPGSVEQVFVEFGVPMLVLELDATSVVDYFLPRRTFLRFFLGPDSASRAASLSSSSSASIFATLECHNTRGRGSDRSIRYALNGRLVKSYIWEEWHIYERTLQSKHKKKWLGSWVGN